MSVKVSRSMIMQSPWRRGVTVRMSKKDATTGDDSDRFDDPPRHRTDTEVFRDVAITCTRDHATGMARRIERST
jgi:hypothetical protein